MARGDKKKIDDLLEAWYLTDSKRKTGKKPTRTDMAREYLANKDLWDSVISTKYTPEQYDERADSYVASELRDAFESLAESSQKRLRGDFYKGKYEEGDWAKDVQDQRDEHWGGQSRRKYEDEERKREQKEEREYKSEQKKEEKKQEDERKRQRKTQEDERKKREDERRKKQEKEDFFFKATRPTRRDAQGNIIQGIDIDDFEDMAEFQRARKIRDKWMEERSGDYLGAPGDSPFQQQQRRQAEGRTPKQYEKSARENASAQFERLKNQYSRLGTEIRDETDPLKRMRLQQERNALIEPGKRYAESLDILEIDNLGQFPFVRGVGQGQQLEGVAKSAFQGKDRVSRVGTEVFGQAGTGSFYRRGELFRGTSYQSTGAINGVMRALAGIFILFVFIGVFYMVFGPIYDSLIHNFTTIVSLDGDPTLGGKDIPTLFDNVAKVVLVWVPLLVFAGALYKLTALVFEREVGTRTTEETEWDMLLAGEDSMDLDAGSDPSVFEAYGGGY